MGAAMAAVEREAVVRAEEETAEGMAAAMAAAWGR
jgi:hypothetical protein